MLYFQSTNIWYIFLGGGHLNVYMLRFIFLNIVSGRMHEEVKSIEYIDFSLYSSVNRLPPSGGVWMLWREKNT